MQRLIVGFFFATAIFAVQVDGADKEMGSSTSEETAIAAYDDLPDEFRERAIKEWKLAMKLAKGSKKEALLKNGPPYYPDIFHSDGKVSNEPGLSKTSWGRFQGDGKVYIDQVISKDKALAKFDKLRFIIADIDTSELTDGKLFLFKKPFFVNGTTSYVTTTGSSKTVYVVRPILVKINPVEDEEPDPK